MSDRRTLGRRAFLEGAYSVGMGLATRFALGSGAASADSEMLMQTDVGRDFPTVIVGADVDLNALDPVNRVIAEYSFNLAENEVPIWRPDTIPSTFSSGKLGMIYESVNPVRRGLGEDGYHIYETPDSGIATPEHGLFPTLYLFGHSRWGEDQVFKKIQNLELGDVVTISCAEHTKIYNFLVTGFRLSSENILRAPEGFGLTMQTTAMDHGEKLLDWDQLTRKVSDFSLVDNWHSNFFVDARPVRIRIPA